MFGSIFVGFLIVFGDVASGATITLKDCHSFRAGSSYVSANGEYSWTGSSYVSSREIWGNHATIRQDTTSYADGDRWVVASGVKYMGKYHHMACGQSTIYDCQAGDWLYWNMKWVRDETCAVHYSSGSSSSGGSGGGSSSAYNCGGKNWCGDTPDYEPPQAAADGQAQGPIPLDSGDDAQTFDDFIPIIIGAAIGVFVVTAIVAVMVIKRKRKRVSDEQAVAMKEVVSAPTVSAAVSTDGVDDTV